MFNPYSIILTLFVCAGLLATLWGLRIILRARHTRQWPVVEGAIEESVLSEDNDDLFPRIRFAYSVGGHNYSQLLKFPADVTPSQEFARSYIDKYPARSSVQVHYNPANPGDATLEPGLARGDWLVFAIGLGMLVLGLLLLLF